MKRFLTKLFFINFVPTQKTRKRRMNIFNKILNDLQVKYNRASQQEIIKPYEFNCYHEPQNILLRIDKGTFYGGLNFTPLKEGSFYFIPASELIYLRCGKANKYPVFGEEGFPNIEISSQFHRKIYPIGDISNASEAFTLVFFDVDIYNAFGLFSFMELPAMLIPPDEELGFLVKSIALEEAQEKIGKLNIIKNYIEEIVIHLCRYINSEPKFQKNVEKLVLSGDKRLLDILRYIKMNLGKDLSNAVLADVACLAEDYVGQFFKATTGKNLQNYIESERLDKAYHLLINKGNTVQEISDLVGFKDASYFSRRFKTKFGINAIDVKRKINYDSNFLVD